MEAGLADVIAHLPVFVRRVDGEVLHWTAGCEKLFGHSAAEAVGAQADKLLQTSGQPTPKDLESALRRKGSWSGRLRHVTKNGSELWTEALWHQRESDNPGGLIVVEQHTDITERVTLEERSALLARELEHRVKNILSVVQALARMSFPDAPDSQRGALDRRIIALSEANKVLQEASWREADLHTIVTEVAGRLGVAERIECDGPQVAVSSDQAMGVALTVHELCTNALKYGACSRDGGTVRITWQVDPADPASIRLRWKESGGPPVEQPRYKGFGSMLIRKAITGADGSSAELHFEPDGVACEMTLLRATYADV